MANREYAGQDRGRPVPGKRRNIWPVPGIFRNRFVPIGVLPSMNNNPQNKRGGPVLRQVARASLLAGSLALLAGCASEPESHVVSTPPPPAPAAAVGVVQQPPTQVVVAGGNAAQAQNSVIVVTQAPPVAQADVVLAQPSSDHKWVPGFWTWRNNRYEWMAGHWEIPPSGDSTWMAPRWERRTDGSYRFYEGYWN